MKRKNVFLAMSLGALGMSGCFYPDDPEPTNARAILVEELLLPEGEIRTKHLHHIKVMYTKYGGQMWDALIGPFPYDVIPIPDPADARYWFNHSTPRIMIMGGWVYMAGECPYSESDLVDATSHGSNSTLVLQIDGPLHRVFLLKKTGGEEATVTLKDVNAPNRVQKWKADQDKYVVAHPGSPPTLDPPQPVSASLAMMKFVADVKARASEAKITDADWIP